MGNKQLLCSLPVTLYVKDFGAIGDGHTDDAKAICAAVDALKAQAPGSVLEFEADKTYYYKDNSSESHVVFDFKHNKGLTVRGNNCLIMMGGHGNVYADVRFCEDITLEGINFDFAEYKPAFAAELESFDMETGSAVLIADRDINLADGECYNVHPWLFGTLGTPYSRYYIWFEKYEMLDRAARRVRVYLRKCVPGAANKIYQTEYSDQAIQIFTDESLHKKHGLILPMPIPSYSRLVEISFECRHNKNFTLRNTNFYTNPYHCMMITGATGEFLFENVNFVRAPYDQGLKFISWGDLFHLTDNRAKFTWKGCKIEHPFDDVFNVMCTTLYVQKKHSDCEITIAAVDPWYGVTEILPGDVLTIVDKKTGMLIGKPVVAEVEEHLPPAQIRLSDQDLLRVRFTEPLPNLRDGQDVLVWDESCLYDPKSEMIDCEMDGTFRTRANMTFTNCRFHVRRFWAGLEVPQEGPLPHDVRYCNCEFTDDDGVFPEDPPPWLIRSYNSIEGGYHIENIVFENCRGIGYDKVLKDPYDEVVIR